MIDRTEAMTVVDVNTGKFTGSGGNLEQTVTRNNLEAAEEIVRQLRLRDIGGIIVIDFIDMVLESNRDLVLRRLTEALARDRTRHQVSEVTSLGLVQLTRKRLGTGLIEAFSTHCTHCGGRGIMLHGDPVDSASTPVARPSPAAARQARQARRQRLRRSPSPRCPRITSASIRCSRRWPRPTVATTTRRSDGEGQRDRPPRKSRGLIPTPSVRPLSRPLRRTSTRTTTSRKRTKTSRMKTRTDEDEIDLDDDDEDEDIDDDDIEVIDDDSDDDEDSDDDSDSDDDDDSDEDDDEDDDDSDQDDDFEEAGEPVPVSPPAGRHRRRAAARPAGPPIHGS